jgi:hypothetical protein
MLLARRTVQLRSAFSALGVSNYGARASQSFSKASVRPQRLLVRAMTSEVDAARAAARSVMHRAFIGRVLCFTL